MGRIPTAHHRRAFDDFSFSLNNKRQPWLSLLLTQTFRQSVNIRFSI